MFISISSPAVLSNNDTTPYLIIEYNDLLSCQSVKGLIKELARLVEMLLELMPDVSSESDRQH